MKKLLISFFATHPSVNTAFVALGVVFIKHEDAQEFLSGVHNQTVETFTREQVDQMEGEAASEQVVVDIPRRSAAELGQLIEAKEKELEEKEQAFVNATDKDSAEAANAEVERVQNELDALNLNLSDALADQDK